MNINEFSKFCSGISYHGCFDDNNWRDFGFPQRPSMGILSKLFSSSRKRITSQLLFNEFHLLGFVDVSCACIDNVDLKSDFYDARTLSIIGMIDDIYYTAKESGQDPIEYLDFLFKGFQSYIFTDLSFADTISKRFSKIDGLNYSNIIKFSIKSHTSCLKQIGLVLPRAFIDETANQVTLDKSIPLDVRMPKPIRDHAIEWVCETADYEKNC